MSSKVPFQIIKHGVHSGVKSGKINFQTIYMTLHCVRMMAQIYLVWSLLKNFIKEEFVFRPPCPNIFKNFANNKWWIFFAYFALSKLKSAISTFQREISLLTFSCLNQSESMLHWAHWRMNCRFPIKKYLLVSTHATRLNEEGEREMVH